MSARIEGLARERIGLAHVLFQSVATMGPAAGIALLIVTGAGFSGGALPLAAVLAMLACLLTATSIGELASRLPSAGGFYTYVSRGIHPSVGFVVAFVYAALMIVGGPLLCLLLGAFVGGTLNAEWGWSFDAVWLVTGIAAALLIAALGYRGIATSTRTGVIVGTFEILVFVVLAVWIIFDSTSQNTLSVFTTEHADVEGFRGMSGVFAASVYVILAFIGFETAAPLAEEAQSPRRTVKQAVRLSAVAVGLIYVLTTYAATVFFGPERFSEFATLGDGNPWDAIARHAWGGGWVILFLAVANSAFGSANALTNAGTRTLYAMGRVRLLPRALATVHPERRSPIVAQAVLLVIGVALFLWLGLQYDPLTAAGLLGAVFATLTILLYMLVNLACILYFARTPNERFRPFVHGVVPIVGIVVFVPPLFAASGIPVFDFVSKLPYPLSLAGPVVIAILVGSLIALAVTAARDPQRIQDTGSIFLDDDDVVPEPDSHQLLDVGGMQHTSDIVGTED